MYPTQISLFRFIGLLPLSTSAPFWKWFLVLGICDLPVQLRKVVWWPSIWCEVRLALIVRKSRGFVTRVERAPSQLAVNMERLFLWISLTPQRLLIWATLLNLVIHRLISIRIKPVHGTFGLARGFFTLILKSSWFSGEDLCREVSSFLSSRKSVSPCNLGLIRLNALEFVEDLNILLLLSWFILVRVPAGTVYSPIQLILVQKIVIMLTSNILIHGRVVFGYAHVEGVRDAIFSFDDHEPLREERRSRSRRMRCPQKRAGRLTQLADSDVAVVFQILGVYAQEGLFGVLNRLPRGLTQTV